METFIWTVFVLDCIAITLNLIALSIGAGNRLEKVISLVLVSGFTIWAGTLIF